MPWLVLVHDVLHVLLCYMMQSRDAMPCYMRSMCLLASMGQWAFIGMKWMPTSYVYAIQ